MFRRPSPALVISVIALFVALGGGTYAATTTSTPSAQTAKKKSKTKRGPRGRRGPRGPKGAKGDTGATGAAGARGAVGGRGLTGGKGSPAASMLTGRVELIPHGRFSYPEGDTPGAGFAAESDATTLSPATPIVARDLSIKQDHVPTNSGDTDIHIYTLSVNGVDSALSCTTTGNFANPTGTFQCTDTTHAVPVAASSTLSLHEQGGSGAGAGDTNPVRFGWRATTP